MLTSFAEPFTWWLAGAAVALLLLCLKTSRPDGKLVKVHPYRRMVPIIMRSRNEAVVYFDTDIRAEKMEAWLEKARESIGANVTHLTVAATNLALAKQPRLNRFIAGRRIYQRDGRWFTFSMKRQKKNQKAKIGVVKLRMEDEESFVGLVERINGQIKHERSGEKTAMDKELDLFGLVPTIGLRVAFKLFLVLDYFGLLPRWFIDGDGMFTSIFIANLGSIGMRSGYHHLYEWGNAPIFITLGAVEDRVVFEGDAIKKVRVLPVRFAFDERIDDGMMAQAGIDVFADVLSDPERWLGSPEGEDRPMIGSLDSNA